MCIHSVSHTHTQKKKQCKRDFVLSFAVEKKAQTFHGIGFTSQAKFPGHLSVWEWLLSLLPI
jgi:hypothetical protein